ncbi:DUF4192 family protein [Saccharothrix luteola]|uniref:DUF4192 family protein n=1 Tax=Saccharothrix luteola TaxID=2893018 RepID=UPI0022A86323|nr:DUF4192 family protein [Saccharothrix luteola]
MGRIALPVAHRLWTPAISAGVRWQCYDDPTCTDVLPSPDQTTLGAASVTAGWVTYDNRSELADLLTPDDERALARRATRSREDALGG